MAIPEAAAKPNLFFIPYPSGRGNGVCQVSLKIYNARLEAIETCGGHDGNVHTVTAHQAE